MIKNNSLEGVTASLFVVIIGFYTSYKRTTKEVRNCIRVNYEQQILSY